MPIRRALLVPALLLLTSGVLLLGGLVAGSDGWSLGMLGNPGSDLIVWQVRAPRTLGAWLTGALLGLGGALAQGLFRNPLAEPYLLGAGQGATLGVVFVLAAGTLGAAWGDEAGDALTRIGLVAAAFAGALLGVMLTLLLSRGAAHTTTLLLGGVVVGFLLGACADLVTQFEPEILRSRQAFLLGSTGLLDWRACALLFLGLAASLLAGWPLARGLDALTLGEDTATSLGLAVARLRLVVVLALAFATALAVAQTGLIAFVGLVAPHLARRTLSARHALLVPAAAAFGGCLLLAADLLARTLIAPEELPVGVLTAVLGGVYLLVLLWRRRPHA
jgi:iron complex transport system permease protein